MAISFVGMLPAIIPTTPWASLDGRLNAPTGTAQYPTYFTSLNGISPYPVRPPWKVAGVDYRVGINTGVTLKDPNTINPAIATISGTNPIVLGIQQNDVTLDGYDFTTGGWWRIHTNSNNNLVISNSKLQNFCIFGNGGNTVTVKYCEIDGLGAAGETTFGTLILLQTGVTLTFQYNYIHDSQNDMIDVTTVDIDSRWNLFDTMGYEVGAHADSIQMAGDGTANNVKLLFNTYVHRLVTTSSPSSFLDVETQVGTAPVINNPEIAYNTASYTAGGPNGSTFYRIAQDVGTISGAYVHDNYADPTNMIAVLSDSTAGTGYTKSGNILLTTGGSF